MPATASSGVFTTATIKSVKNSNNPVRSKDTIKNTVTVLPMQYLNFSLSLAPTAWAIHTVVPIDKPTIMTVIICMICEPMDTAVMLSTPSNWPMMKRSAKP